MAFLPFPLPSPSSLLKLPTASAKRIPKGSSLPNLFFHNPSHSPYIIYSYIIFIFSEKEPRIGGLHGEGSVKQQRRQNQKMVK